MHNWNAHWSIFVDDGGTESVRRFFLPTVPASGVLACQTRCGFTKGGHCSGRTKKELALIFGCLTSVIMRRRLYTEWMTSGSHEQTPTGRLKRAPLEAVLGWVLSAWNSVSTDVVTGSFKVTGISNSLDGAEDDCLWEDGVPQHTISDTESEDSLSDDD
ncbi:hypothetical protein HPB51_023832 [Rhipicephalus microplus]|uniref:DDE-1 domain-containing protein n=1 Tax=Rhipicephalus microplus TaxID=6941 RepID=A0A9J6EDN5_RHIMP|nr:hypothetical protein HPB51_023832 [Rhipicephalus microplus]